MLSGILIHHAAGLQPVSAFHIFIKKASTGEPLSGTGGRLYESL